MNKFLFLVLAAGTLFASNSFAQEQQPELSRDQKIAIAKREIREAIVRVNRYKNDNVRRALWTSEAASLCLKAEADLQMVCDVQLKEVSR